jgi:hypothetical protein
MRCPSEHLCLSSCPLIDSLTSSLPSFPPFLPPSFLYYTHPPTSFLWIKEYVLNLLRFKRHFLIKGTVYTEEQLLAEGGFSFVYAVRNNKVRKVKF